MNRPRSDKDTTTSTFDVKPQGGRSDIMKKYSFAIAGLTAGIVLAVLGLVGSRTVSGDAAADTASTPRTLTSADFLEPVGGLRPIAAVVELWRRRSLAHDLDYLSRTNLGVALADQARQTGEPGGFVEAEEALDDALALNPQHLPAQLALASVYAAQHRFAEANDLADSVRAADDTSLGALAVIGDTSLELGNYEDAAAAYHQLAAAERTAPVVARLARLAWIEGDNDGAVERAEEALELSTGDALRPDRAAFYHFQLGHFRFEAGDGPGAVAALETARVVDPGNGGATEKLAAVHIAIGNVDAALDLYAELTAEGAAADVHGSYADLLFSVDRGDEAQTQEALALELAALTIDEVPAERRHLVGFYLARDPALAVELAEADLADRNGVEAYDTLAWALHHVGRNDEAAQAIERALAEGTRSVWFHYHAGVIRHALGDDEMALMHIEEALAINPNFDADGAARAQQLRRELTSVSSS